MIVTVSLNPSLDVEWLVETLHFEDRNPVLRERRDAGGKAINVSRVMHELRGETRCITTAGGRTGAELRERLASAKISARVVPIKGETRENLAVTQADGRRSIRLNMCGPNLSAGELRAVLSGVEDALPRAKMMVLSGSLPPNVPTDIYARLIRLARKSGVPTALDADGEVLQRGIMARPWLVKPNRFEAERLLGRKIRDPRRAAIEIMERWNLGVVLLSLGKDGAIVVSRQGRGAHLGGQDCTTICLRANSPPVRVRSAIGAGDSALAAFLLRWLKMRDAGESLRWAMAAGAACAMTPATELCHRRDVERLVKRVRVEAGES